MEEIKNKKELEIFLKDFKPSWKAFADNFLETFNSTDAYLKANPNAKKESAMVLGSKLLRNIKIQSYLNFRYKQRQQKFEVSENKLLENLIEIKNRNLEVARDREKSEYDRRASEKLVIKAIEVIAKITGLDKSLVANINFNQFNQFNQNVIIKTFVVPSFKSSISPPQISSESIQEMVQDYIKERKS